MAALWYLPHCSLSPLQTYWDLQTVEHWTALYLGCWLPDTAGKGKTSADHEPPFYALIYTGQQVDGLQPAAVCWLPLDPCAASWCLAQPFAVHALPFSKHVSHLQGRWEFQPQLSFCQQKLPDVNTFSVFSVMWRVYELLLESPVKSGFPPLNEVDRNCNQSTSF